MGIRTFPFKVVSYQCSNYGPSSPAASLALGHVQSYAGEAVLQVQAVTCTRAPRPARRERCQGTSDRGGTGRGGRPAAKGQGPTSPVFLRPAGKMGPESMGGRMGGRVPPAELGAQGWDRVRPPNSAIERNHVQCKITKTKINTKICDAQNIKIFSKVRVSTTDLSFGLGLQSG